MHVVHGSFKNGETSTQWGLKKVLKAAYYILHGSPARRDDYNSISGSTVYPLNFCATRWVLDENSKVTITSCLHSGKVYLIQRDRNARVTKH